MTQDAVVIKSFENGLAEVLVARGTSCGEHCGSCSVCKYVGEIHTYAKNKIHAAAGDKVVIESKTSEVLGAAFMIYIIPMVAMLVAYLAAAGMGFGENVAVPAAFIAFAIFVGIVTIYQRARAKKKEIELVIVSYRLDEDED
ncbi:MAG: SoxR reducing system RseC family protein [Oscillospiraceae bacterium]|nr:SoxR reducing system RseC family protein [Oscillospiraceae bacterium]